MIPTDEHSHVLVTVYERPWWNWFRKTHSLHCWTCKATVYAWTRRGSNEVEK